MKQRRFFLVAKCIYARMIPHVFFIQHNGCWLPVPVLYRCSYVEIRLFRRNPIVSVKSDCVGEIRDLV